MQPLPRARTYDTAVWLVAPLLRASLPPAAPSGPPDAHTGAGIDTGPALGQWACTGVLLLLVAALVFCPIAVALSAH